MQYTTLGDVESDGVMRISEESSPLSRSTRNGHGPNPSLQEPLTEEDPFYVFREDLYRKLDLVEEGLTEYLRIVHQTDTAVNTHALKDAKKQLKRHIKNAESTLKDVQMTVQLVETQRDKFAHIGNSEMYDRKTLVSTSQDRVARAKEDMNSSQVKSKLLQDERAKALRRAEPPPHDDDHSHNGDPFVTDSATRTSLLMQQQDETLEELDEAVVRVGHMASTIHEELGTQNKVLDEIEEDLTDAEEKLGAVMGKLAKLLKTKDKCQLGTILALLLTVLVLFFLVLYT